MKNAINNKQLKKLNACKSGYDVFFKAHGKKSVSLLDVLESNGVEYVLWLIDEQDKTTTQVDDFILLGADFAENVVHFFESKFPGDLRPRAAIGGVRDFFLGKISKHRLQDLQIDAASAADDARAAYNTNCAYNTTYAARATYAAAYAAADAAYDAARAATYAARAAADAADYAAYASYGAYGAERQFQTNKLREMLIKWENES
jgi:hypothetical protein